jgi:chemotaxis protein histidine kinase CheA
MEGRSSLERLEGQLLTLEWEINKENLQRTRQEVRLLKQRGEGGSEGASLLGFMEKVLSRMISHEETISPSLIKFLMDSKETLKLLLEKDGEGEIEALKRLAREGIEAKFTCLQLSPETPPTPLPSLSAEEILREESAGPAGRVMDEIMGRVSTYFTKMEAGLKKVNEHLALLDERVRHAPPSPEVKRTVPEPVATPGMSLTLVRVNERFFGVPTDRAVRLFKVPPSLSRQVMRQSSIRLKGMEVWITDLRRIFSLPGNSAEREQRLLIVQNGGTYKGLVVEQVLPRISTSGVERQAGPYSWGTFRWAYQGRPVSVPILDLNQL